MLLLKTCVIIFPFLFSFAAHLLDETDSVQYDSAVHEIPLQLTFGGKSLLT